MCIVAAAHVPPPSTSALLSSHHSSTRPPFPCSEHNLAVRIVRIFNTYGPRMALDDGRVVSNFVAQVTISASSAAVARQCSLRTDKAAR